MAATISGIDAADLARFEKLGEEWWAQKGPMRELHRLNPLRLTFIRDHCRQHFMPDQPVPTGRPMSDLRVLDIGCGGGILCEPMARMGAEVTGIDPGPANIGIAAAHAAKSGLTIDYRATTAEDLAAQGMMFDVVTAMEVVEHVTSVPAFLATAASLVRPGGLLFVSTLNRTLKSFALAIVGAEYVLRWLPVGTHKWDQFVTPDELARPLRRAGLKMLDQTGVVYNPVQDVWQMSGDTDVNYMVVAGA